MKEIVNKLIEVERSTSSEKGDYELFAMALREDAFDKWDILVAANWINRNKENALKYLAKNIQKSFPEKDLLLFSRIVIIDETNPALSALQMTISVEHGQVEIKDSNFLGLQIKHAFLITCKKANTEVTAG